MIVKREILFLLCLTLILPIQDANGSRRGRRRKGRPMDLDKLEEEMMLVKRGRKGDQLEEINQQKVNDDDDGEMDKEKVKKWRHMAKINPYIGNILFAFSSVNSLLKPKNRPAAVMARTPTGAHNYLSPQLQEGLTGALQSAGGPHLNLGGFLEPFRSGSLTGQPPTEQEETEQDRIVKGQLLSILNRPDFQHVNLGNVLTRYLKEKDTHVKPHPKPGTHDLGEILGSILHKLSKSHPGLDKLLHGVLHEAGGSGDKFVLVNFVNALQKILNGKHHYGGAHSGDGNDGDLNLNKKCYKKVTLSQQVIFEEKQQCTTTVQEECVPVYKTELVPTEVTECNTRFKKVCYFEYMQDVRQRLVRTCTKKKERDCDAKGEIKCSHEYDLVCERLADGDDGSYDDNEHENKAAHRSGRGTFQVPEEFMRSSEGTYSSVTVPGGHNQGEGNYNSMDGEAEYDPNWVDVSSVDDSALDCVETYTEHCDYADDRLTHGGSAKACVRQPEVDCQPHKDHVDQPAIKCRQVQRKVCGPEACPVKEGPLECQEKLKRTAEEVPVETCHMSPEDICRRTHKILPKLVTEQKCVDTPRHECVTVTLPKTIKKPTIQKTCTKQDNTVLVVIGGCDYAGYMVNTSIAVDLSGKTHFYEFVEVAADAPSKRLARDYGIYEHQDNRQKPGYSFVNVGPKPDTLPKLADLPFKTSAASGGLMNFGFLQCGGTVFAGLCVSLDPRENMWKKTAILPEKRLLAASAIIGGETLLLAGGYSSFGPLSSTLFIKDQGTMVTSGPHLPEALVDACAVSLDSMDSVVFTGGLKETAGKDGILEYSPKAYLHKLGEGGCQELPDMNVPRASHACAVIPCEHGYCVMVAGGQGVIPQVRYSTEVLSLQTLQWTAGPELPFPLVGGSLVPFNGTVLAVGGVHSKKIFELDIEKQAWYEHKEKLPGPRSAFVASVAPQALFDIIKAKNPHHQMLTAVAG